LLLDEPTDGLDPGGIRWFRNFILRLRDERGMTVLFNSHLLAEVELMCDRVTILREGRRVFEGSVSGLQTEEQVFDASLDPWEKAIPIIHSLGGETPSPGRIRLPENSDPSALIESLVKAGVRVRSLAPVKRSLEDFYMELLHQPPTGTDAR
jgi:ABC-2 type transport system ATP-binding protein